MGLPRLRRRARSVLASKYWLAAALVCAGCGGERTIPTVPAPTSVIPVTLAVTPNPLKATVVGESGSTVTYRIAADVALAASSAAGAGARISSVTTRVTFTQNTFLLSMSNTRNVSLQVPASGALTSTYTDEFGTSSSDTVTWHVEVVGVDAEGRPFIASSARIPITF